MGHSEKDKVYDRNYQNEYRKRFPERVRATQRKIKFGITAQDFERMLALQDSKCAICSIPITESAAVDHDHVTGRVRGLLCRGCNLGLGWFRDDPMILQRAIEYLGKV